MLTLLRKSAVPDPIAASVQHVIVSSVVAARTVSVNCATVSGLVYR